MTDPRTSAAVGSSARDYRLLQHSGNPHHILTAQRSEAERTARERLREEGYTPTSEPPIVRVVVEAVARGERTVHDHRCSNACAASEEHLRAMDADADRQVAEAEVDDDPDDVLDAAISVLAAWANAAPDETEHRRRCALIVEQMRDAFDFDLPVPLAASYSPEWEPRRWWRVVNRAEPPNIWCETSDEDEARRALVPGLVLQRLWHTVTEYDWRDA